MTLVVNRPSLGVSEARRLLREWARSPRALARPVLVISGWMYPSALLSPITNALLACTTNGREWVHVSGCPFHLPIQRLAKRLVLRYQDLSDRYGVDVIGVSMGGIVAREAARSRSQPRLRVVRLFTLGTPHGGARALAKLAPHHQAQQLARGSRFLDDLNADPTSRDFPIETFGLAGDHLVSPQSAHAVSTRRNHWNNALMLLPAHSALHRDPRIIATLVGRLLGRQLP